MDRYAARRERFQARLLESAEGKAAVALFFSGAEQGLQGFLVDPGFYYLTGIETAGAALAFSAAGGKVTQALFLPESDPAGERWTGKVLAAGGLTRSADPDEVRREASRATGVEAISPYHHLDAALARPLGDAELLYLDFRREGFLPGPVEAFAERIVRRYSYLQVRHGGRLLGDLRRVKDPHEIELMRESVRITDEAHQAVLRHLRPGLAEYEIQALVEYLFKSQGSRHLAFASIVGSGPNSCVLHYERNDRRMKRGDLVVCDIGCRKDFYCADVTRTYPVSGRFTRRQAKVYGIVLDAQLAAIEAARPGAYVRDLHAAATQVISKAGFARQFFHGTGHYLGLEAHDAGSTEKPLEPGVVVTVEPGVYLADENLGVRIEDDVLVTEGGAEVLSSAPKAAAEVERALSARRRVIVI
jgi:Xaa-Pro aminopeptidase